MSTPGRPSTYTKEIAEAICFEVASTAKGLKTICAENENFPAYSTVFKWLNDKDKTEFVDMYTRAREEKSHMLFDEIVEIADTVKKGRKVKILPDGKKETTTGDMVERSRLQMDARKFATARLLPRKYGDKIDITSKGDKINNGPDLSGMTFEQLQALANGIKPTDQASS